MICKNLHALAAAALALALTACGSSTTAPSGDAPTTAATEASPPATLAAETPAPPATPTDAANDGYPDLAAALLTPAAERTVKGARNVLLSFARALELKEWDQAWSMLDDQSKAKWPKAQWAKMFADLDKVTVAIPTGTMEGAAGSSYYTAPVTITATDKKGRPIAYTGEAVLRRVNDVPGASQEQLHWHFETLTLDWTH